MLLPVLAALLWLCLHIGVAGTALRGAIVARLGEAGFRAAFSLASAVALVLLVMAWREAPPLPPMWFAPGWLRMLLAAAMLPAFVLLVASFRRNPTAAGGEARGIQRVTRHPMLWSIAIWAAVHVVGNGDMASLIFFGTFLTTALAGMPSIDAKLAARQPEAWARLGAATSILPFGAILAGRNRLSLREIGWGPPLLGLLAWAALLHLHGRLFGVPALPAP